MIEVIACFEGNGCRPSHMGSGFRVGGVLQMFTLNSTEVHGVVLKTKRKEKREVRNVERVEQQAINERIDLQKRGGGATDAGQR